MRFHKDLTCIDAPTGVGTGPVLDALRALFAPGLAVIMAGVVQVLQCISHTATMPSHHHCAIIEPS